MKTLGHTTSVLALALGMAAPVCAADIVKLGPGGTYLAAATDDDEARGPKLRDEAFNRGSEIQFKGRTVLDNGLEVGFHTEISRQDLASRIVQSQLTPGQDAASRVDSVFVYVKSGFGTVALGDHQNDRSAFGDMTSYLAGVSRSDDGQISLPVFHPLELRNPEVPDASGRLGKVSYFTPRFGGVQFGVSFNPASTVPGAVTLNLPPGAFDAMGYSKSLEFAANYKTEFKGFQVELGGSYLSGKWQTQGTDDLVQWGAGGSFGYALPHGRGHLALAGAYRNSNCDGFLCGAAANLTSLDAGTSNSWNFGLRYSLGSWALGGYFLTGHRADTLGTGLSNQTTTVFLQTAIDF